MAKMWGGAFEKEMDAIMEQLNASIPFDWQLWAADIRGSMAYAKALAQADLITEAERDRLLEGLQEVYAEFEAGQYQVRLEDEDIHTAVERRLHVLIGDVAGKLHTGRSRNDQVATDTRLYLLQNIQMLRELLRNVQRAIVSQAEAQIGVIMPGYTHLQQAQPVLFSHWLMSYFWRLQRDKERLDDLTTRVDVCPLGSGALAGHAFGIDRAGLADELGFARISQNSIDAVSDRDYIAEFFFWASLLQVHLSQLAEDLIIWSSAAYGFVRLDESYSTGSSIMPQKRNPDSLELQRGKAGRLIGHLMGLLTTLKGLPSAYDKDLQEDKEGLFDAVNTLKLVLPVAAGVIGTLQVDATAMAQALDDGLLATDLADYLVRKGIPFRESHGLVGAAVRAAEEAEIPLRELPLTTFQEISPAFEDDVYKVFDYRRAVELKDALGGTATSAVEKQIEAAKQFV
jgi:argininosuccinate lyase